MTTRALAVELLQCAADLALASDDEHEREWPAVRAGDELFLLNTKAWLLAYETRIFAARKLYPDTKLHSSKELNSADTLLEAAGLLLDGWEPKI